MFPDRDDLTGEEELSARGGGHRAIYRSQPIVTVGFGAAGQAEKFVLQLAGDGASDAFADGDVIDGSNRRDFHGGPYEEDFVDDVKHFAGDDRFFHRNVQVFGELHDSVAGDAGKNAGGQRGSVERAAVDEEHVHAGAFADVAAGIESDSFSVAVERRFHTNQLGIHVICGGLGHGWQGIGCDARPGTDADVDTFSERFGAEVGSPAPAGHVHVDGRVEGIDADFSVAAQDDRLDITGIELVEADQFGGDVAEIRGGIS